MSTVINTPQRDKYIPQEPTPFRPDQMLVSPQVLYAPGNTTMDETVASYSAGFEAGLVAGS